MMPPDRGVRPVLSRWLRLLAMIGLAGLAVAALLPDRDQLPRSPFPGQFEHFLAYAAAAALAGFAFAGQLRLGALLFLIVAYAGLLEFAQRWAPDRSASVLDFTASAAGAFAGIAFCALVLRLVKAQRRR